MPSPEVADSPIPANLPPEITMNEARDMAGDVYVDIDGGSADTPSNLVSGSRTSLCCNIVAAQVGSGTSAAEVAASVEVAIYKVVQDHVQTSKKIDYGGILAGAVTIGEGAQKDIKWALALSSPLRDKAVAAYSKEMTSLQETILKRVDESHPK